MRAVSDMASGYWPCRRDAGDRAGFFPAASLVIDICGQDHIIRRQLSAETLRFLHGLAGEIKVKGTVYNSVMPAFGEGSGFNWNDEKKRFN